MIKGSDKIAELLFNLDLDVVVALNSLLVARQEMHDWVSQVPLICSFCNASLKFLLCFFLQIMGEVTAVSYPRSAGLQTPGNFRQRLLRRIETMGRAAGTFKVHDIELLV